MNLNSKHMLQCRNSNAVGIDNLYEDFCILQEAERLA